MTSRTARASALAEAANRVDDTAFNTAWADAEGRATLERILADRVPAPTQKAPRRRRRVAIGAAVAATAGAAVAIVGLPGTNHSGAPAAWAVTKNADGSVSVKISDYRDPAGLQARLRAAGLRAEVGTLPKQCDDYLQRYIDPEIRAQELQHQKGPWRFWLVSVQLGTFRAPYDYTKLLWIGYGQVFEHEPFRPGIPTATAFVFSNTRSPDAIGMTMKIQPSDLPPQDTVRIGFPADRAGERMSVGVFSTESGLYCSPRPLPAMR